MRLSDEVVTALISAGVGASLGWALGFIGDGARQRRRDRKEARAAALVIFGELAESLGNLWVARQIGLWTSSQSPRRTAWDAYGVILMRGGSVDTLAPLALAYSSLADADWLISASEDADFRTDEGRALESAIIPRVEDGLRAVGMAAGLTSHDIERRLQSIMEAPAD